MVKGSESAENRCAAILERKGITLIPEEELKGITGEARSIGANNQPDAPEYIGSVGIGYGTYHYFKDADEKFYYLSSRIMEFDRQMRETQKRRKAVLGLK